MSSLVGAEGGSSLKDGTSRVTGDCHARICEELGVKSPGLTLKHAVEQTVVVTEEAPIVNACKRNFRNSKGHMPADSQQPPHHD
jgi:hypothetical protein